MEPEPLTRTIEAAVHGRYLVRVPPGPGPWPVLFSFHGYAEDAAINIAALKNVPGLDAWLVVAVQALHPFYTRNQRIVASWMTRQDRDLSIADNSRYVSAVVSAISTEFSEASTTRVFAGFSQGGAMAYRAAAHVGAAGVIVLAADVPPDVIAPARFSRVLLGRGVRDEWYTEAQMGADLERLQEMGVNVETCVFDGGHEWTAEFAAAAGVFLNRIR